MPLTVYPVGAQVLKIATTIDIPAVNTPFNPDAINPAIVASHNGVKALEAYGMFGADFYKARPPYPTSGGPYVNSQTYYLSGGLILTGAAGIAFASPSARSYTRGPKGLYAVTISADQWIMPTTGGNFNGAFEQGTDVTTGSPILWIMNVPPGSTITGASVWVDPPSGHGGVLPSTPPSFRLYRYNTSTSANTLVPSSATSDATAIGTYESPHQFSSGVLSSVVAEEEIVVMQVRGEYGGSALAGLKVYAPAVTFTRTKLGEE